ncbi:N-acetylglucosamine kinase [Mycobacterium sp. smrl_JER01]|uniref:N-acetylglucosamine kinase n=1 Tax=Mycobacterium sp. smrl_JER01 TaxID=3402633 RepID=UPI003AD4D6CF
MAVYLGVDGGGSKTAFALIDHHGAVLARATGASSYYFGHGIDVVEDVIQQGIAQVCGEGGLAARDIDFAFIGLPGYGEASADLEQLDAVPSHALGHERYLCANDMVCGWAGSLAGEDGINVICGTGSMTYGELRGTGRRVGGWGELFGDEGSAYWVATQGLNAFSRMSDGRLPRSPLYALVRDRLSVTSDLDAVGLVIEQWGGNRGSIAALATTVCAAAAHGDRVAQGIVAAACDELALLVDTTRVSIGYDENDRVPVSYSGGMFCDPGFLQMFRRALEQLPATFDLQSPLLDPAVGAALYAAKRSGSPLPTTAVARLISCEAMS